jgi:type II secretory pathway component GspD/PulD (secretin)
MKAGHVSRAGRWPIVSIGRAALLALLWAGIVARAAADGPEAKVTLDAKDADVREIAEALSRAAGFQVVFDPGISCRLSVDVREQTWLKVLRASLAACGLDYEDDGAVIRVTRRDTLTREAADRKRLSEEWAREPPDRVRLFHLSYARAREMAPLLEKLLSGRAEVSYDERSNTLIIVD